MLDTLPDDWERPVEPERPAWSGYVFQAWRQLDGDRPLLPGPAGGIPLPGRIPFSAVDRWARRYGITGFGFDLFVRLIDEMDAVYLAHLRGKSG